MFIKILTVILLAVYIALNLITAKIMDANEMKIEFIDGQCVVGRVFANIFYLPAWVLKALRFVVVSLVK